LRTLHPNLLAEYHHSFAPAALRLVEKKRGVQQSLIEGAQHSNAVLLRFSQTSSTSGYGTINLFHFPLQLRSFHFLDQP
jgi:hypothetical protein